jgi:hypothetical protein
VDGSDFVQGTQSPDLPADLVQSLDRYAVKVSIPGGPRSRAALIQASGSSVYPAVTGIVPTNPPVVNGNQNIDVGGNYFQPGLTVDFYNASGVKIATLSGTQVVNVTTTAFTMVVNLGSSPGTFGFEVVNPDGKRSARFAFSTR